MPKRGGRETSPAPPFSSVPDCTVEKLTHSRQHLRPGVAVVELVVGRLRGSPQTQEGARSSRHDIVAARGDAPLRFGTRDGASFLAGALSGVAIYPRVLTAAEIRDHCRVGGGQ